MLSSDATWRGQLSTSANEALQQTRPAFTTTGAVLAAERRCSPDPSRLVTGIARGIRTATVLATLFGLATYGAAQPGASAPVLESPLLEAVAHPDRVESLTVRSLLEPESGLEPTPSNLPGPFRILDDPTPIPVETASQLSQLLLANASYLQAYKMCIFQPGVAFRFWKGTESVDVLVCFSCSDLAFQVTGAAEAVGTKLAFDPSRADLLALARQARPTDDRLTDLK
jgi:hypothetical protein